MMHKSDLFDFFFLSQGEIKCRLAIKISGMKYHLISIPPVAKDVQTLRPCGKMPHYSCFMYS